ncbi:MAG: HRDC domain-containing protein [Dehalococcoidia bacterium]|nr:HRDC domain-containing protein [Dehalococcoidia bacterium]
MTNLPVQTITSGDQLAAAVKAMHREPAIALDTESNSFFRYPEQLCLVQIATSRAVVIVDPLAFSEVLPLKALLASPSLQKIIHAADYDVRSLDRAWGFRVSNIYDTNLAARFAGMTQLGLAALAQELLGVRLNKEKRLQRSDWGQRPLNREALEYAAADVRHLMAIRDELDKRLRLLGRTGWVAEEFTLLERIRYEPPDTESAFLAVKGSRDLSPRGLAVLRALFAFRDLEALRQGRPYFRVLGDATLVYLAAQPEADLAQTPGLGPAGLQRFGPSLRQAIQEGRSAPSFHRPRPAQRRDRPTQEQIARLQMLKAWRSALGQRLSMDPSLLWPMASMERLAGQTSTLDAELAAHEVRAWQFQEFGASLRTLLVTT